MHRKKVLTVLAVLAILTAVLLTVILVRQRQSAESNAAAADKLETEGGVLAGNATATADTSASGGSYVALGINQTSSPTPSPQADTGLASCTALDKGTAKINPPALSMPGYLQSTTDPTFGTKITRVTGNPGTAIPNVTGKNWGQIGGSTYAKVPAWNADESLIVMQNISTSGWLFLDGNDYQVRMLRTGVPGYSVGEARWHPTDPNLMIWVSTDGKAGYWNPTTNVATKLFDPGTVYSLCRFGPYEGNASNNGRRIVINCGDESTSAATFFAVDLSTGARISPVLTAGQVGFSSLDWATISPNGDYIVASQNSALNKSLSFTPTSFSVKGTWSNMGHYDLGIDTSGNQVAGNSTGYFVRLSDNVATNIMTRISYPYYHTSTRNTNVPGWMYASLEGGPSSSLAMDNEIVAMELKAGGRIRRMTNHRSTAAAPYEHSAFGSASPDGKRVFYRSDWGNSSGPVYGFVVDTRNICP